MISHEQRWIFVHVQKTGGNSIRTALGVELNDQHKQVALPHANSSEHGSYRDYYTQETAKLVAERYQRDLDAFGYRFGD
jgi:hypothetical protein